MAKEFKERRSASRVSAVCRIAVLSGLRIVVYNAGVENIGEGGMRVILHERLAAATPVSLDIYLQDTVTRISCKGEVVWVNERFLDSKSPAVFDTGIKFIDIHHADKIEIEKLAKAPPRPAPKEPS